MDVSELLKRAADSATAGRAFGPAIERNDCTVVPVSWVVSTGGGGGAFGTGDDNGRDPSSGGGGGFAGVTWPLGVYVIKDGSVRWVPAVDMTRLALGGLALVRHLIKRRSRHHARSA